MGIIKQNKRSVEPDACRVREKVYDRKRACPDPGKLEAGTLHHVGPYFPITGKWPQ